jgi:hypothetical protein
MVRVVRDSLRNDAKTVVCAAAAAFVRRSGGSRASGTPREVVKIRTGAKCDDHKAVECAHSAATKCGLVSEQGGRLGDPESESFLQYVAHCGALRVYVCKYAIMLTSRFTSATRRWPSTLKGVCVYAQANLKETFGSVLQDAMHGPMEYSRLGPGPSGFLRLLLTVGH